MRAEIIQQALGGPLGDASAADVADASVRALSSLFGQLEPLVGVQGTRALYERCRHLAQSSFLWPPAPELMPRDEWLSAVRDRLADSTAADAWRVSEALLIALAGLLVSLIGEPLTLRLLHSAWGDPRLYEPSLENSQ